jgi:Gamma-glutamyl cyclotransferase, AIG2-like
MENLFSYGTLQLEAVQLATFGRSLTGKPDVLVGYTVGLIEIKDDDVVATSGITNHTIAVYTGNPDEVVPGVLYQVTEEELANADDYETADYQRVWVEFQSGDEGWVYVGVGA